MIRQLITLIVIFSIYSPFANSQNKKWTLEECIEHAIANNIQVKQQEIQVKYGENTLLQSRLNRLPTLNAQASNNYSFGRALDETTYQFTENESVIAAQFYGSAGVILFNGLQQVNSIKRNRFSLEANLSDLEAMKESIALNVALSYLQILLNKELITVTENQLLITKEQIEKTRKLVDAGSLAMGTLLNIEAQAAREEVQLINNSNQFDISLLTLTQLLELESAQNFEIATPEYDMSGNLVVESNLQQVYSEAVSRKPEIESAKLRLEGARQDLLIAKGGRSPRLSLNSTFSSGYSDIRRKILGIDPVLGVTYGDYPFFEQLNDNINYGIGLNLSIPIFNGWQVSTSIKNSNLAIESNRYNLESARKDLYKNIQQAFADAEGSLKSYVASQTAVAAMEEAFHYTEQKLNVGMVTTVEYNSAKTDLLNAQSDLAQSKYRFLFRIKVLDFYRGLPLTLES